MQKTAAQIYDFMQVIENLCLVRRDMIRADGQKESDSDHILKLLFLLMMVLPYLKHPVDAQKVLEMALVHDLVEAEVGDTSRLQSDHSDAVRAHKKELERTAIEKYRTMLPEPIGQKIYDLFMEYEARASFEAKLVKSMDRFEGDMQALKENKGARFYQNGRYKFILDYLCVDLATAESDGEPMLAQLQKIQLNQATQNIDECLALGLINKA